MRLWKFETLLVFCCLTLVSRAGNSTEIKETTETTETKETIETKETTETKESKEKGKRHVLTAVTKFQPASESLKCRQSNGEEGICLSISYCFQEKLYSAIAGIEPLHWGKVDKCSYPSEGGAVFYGACCTGVQRSVYFTPLLVPIVASNDLPSTSLQLPTRSETGLTYVPLSLASGSASWPFGNLPSFQQPGGITWILGPSPATTPQKGTPQSSFGSFFGLPGRPQAPSDQHQPQQQPAQQPQQQQYPSYNPAIPPDWPPPLPTHPPGHDTHPPLPTHPPGHDTHPPLPTHPPSPLYPTPPGPPSPPTPPPYPQQPGPPPYPQQPGPPPYPQQPGPPPYPQQPGPPPYPPPTQAPAPVWPPPIGSTPPPRPPTDSPSPTAGSCGTKSMTFRIVGGVPAERHAWRWMAGLFMRGRLFCGGSLIDEYTVLTAAHCVKSVNAHALTIHLGDHDTSSTTETDHITVRASRIIVHPAYNDVNNHNDVAIIRLASKVTYTAKVYPICLPSSSETSDFAGQIATVAGWGSLAYGRPTSPTLNEVNIRVWNNRDCANAYRGHFPGQIVDSFVCAGQQGQDSCTGDSGGPLMIQKGGTWIQIGVVSWGIRCGSTQFPGVYSRVTSFLSWINSNRH